MPKPYFRSSSSECDYQSIHAQTIVLAGVRMLEKPGLQQLLNSFRMYSDARKPCKHQLACSPNEFFDPVKDRDWLLTKSQKYRPQRFPRENAFWGGMQVRRPPKKTMLTLLQGCVTHAWQGFQQPHGLAPVDGTHLQTNGALLLLPRNRKHYLEKPRLNVWKIGNFH